VAGIVEWAIDQLITSHPITKEAESSAGDRPDKRAKGGLKRVEKGMLDPIKDFYAQLRAFYYSQKGYQVRLIARMVFFFGFFWFFF
jgi:hypothetical protein